MQTPVGQRTEAVRSAYDVVAGTYAGYFPDTSAEARLDLAMVDAFAAVVSAVPDSQSRVLDAGSGTGRMSGYLAERGMRAVGVDLSPGMVAEARRGHPTIGFGVGSLTGLPFEDASFDGVLVWYSAIHTPPTGQPAIFAEVARVVRPGGYVLVGLHSGRGERDVGEVYRRFGHDIELVRYLFTPDEVAQLLSEAGFVEKARMVRRPRDGERDDNASLLARRD